MQRGTFRLLRMLLRLPIGESRRQAVRRWLSSRFPAIRIPASRPDAPSPLAHRPHQHAAARAIGHRDPAPGDLPDPLPARLIAFYLPQFHPIAENNAWWGQGFTEWSNTTRALPQFEGHAQPKLPADLGFYDLRSMAVLRDQARLAREHGISAFCFYFYWFGGRTLLEEPLRVWREDPSIELDFCICWANESWSRRWDGRGDETLIEQRHDAEDDIAFITHAAAYLRDPRYLRADGRPLLLVYRPELLPDANATSGRWRAWCREQGIGEIYLANVHSFEHTDPRAIGFDAAVEFPPNLSSPSDITHRFRLINPDYSGQVVDWREMALEYQTRPAPGFPTIPGVNCSWDNEPRRSGGGRTYLHSAPRRYRDWLRHAIRSGRGAVAGNDNLVFINAWNEWAEGAALEPDRRLGHAWLQATRDALTPHPLAPARPCVVLHAWHLEELAETLRMVAEALTDFRLLVTTCEAIKPGVDALLVRAGLKAEVLVFENRGRDILPFLHVADGLLAEGEDVVLKLHTKRSAHRPDGDAWRRELLERLVSPSRTGDILRGFAGADGIGMVAPEGHLLQTSRYIGGNATALDYLHARLGLDPHKDSDAFVSGSMFWVRLEALRPLLDAHLEEWEFEPEQGKIDGTFAHAIERVFARCVVAAGYDVVTAASLCGQPETGASTYPYAH